MYLAILDSFFVKGCEWVIVESTFQMMRLLLGSCSGVSFGVEGPRSAVLCWRHLSTFGVIWSHTPDKISGDLQMWRQHRPWPRDDAYPSRRRLHVVPVDSLPRNS
jgi:hypothetical protein